MEDVQELLGHSDVSTTMNVYAYSTRKAKGNSTRLFDKVAGYEVARSCSSYKTEINFLDIASYATVDLNTYSIF